MSLCLLYRRKLSVRVDAGLNLEPALARHVQTCPACRRFYEQELSIARGLARSAGEERVAPSPFLQSRVMAAIERSGRPVRSGLPFGRLAWAGGLAAGLMLLFLVVHSPAPRPVAPALDATTVVKELTALEKRLPDEEKLGQWSGAVDEPLDQEMRSLLHDARNAAQTLVYNFLPENLARSATEGKGNE